MRGKPLRCPLGSCGYAWSSAHHTQPSSHYLLQSRDVVCCFLFLRTPGAISVEVQLIVRNCNGYARHTHNIRRRYALASSIFLCFLFLSTDLCCVGSSALLSIYIRELAFAEWCKFFRLQVCTPNTVAALTPSALFIISGCY